MATLLEKLKGLAEDALELNVVTVSGELDLTVGADATGAPNWEEIFDDLLKNVRPGGKLFLVASTTQKIDQDCVNFVSANPGQATEALIKAHNEMVKAAADARTAMLSFALKAIRGS